MKWFWWFSGISLAITATGAVVSFVLYIIRDEERFLEVARSFRHWVIVIALASFNIGIFKHIISTIISFWY